MSLAQYVSSQLNEQVGDTVKAALPVPGCTRLQQNTSFLSVLAQFVLWSIHIFWPGENIKLINKFTERSWAEYCIISCIRNLSPSQYTVVPDYISMTNGRWLLQVQVGGIISQIYAFRRRVLGTAENGDNCYKRKFMLSGANAHVKWSSQTSVLHIRNMSTVNNRHDKRIWGKSI